MRINGYLQYCIGVATEINDIGEPIIPSSQWSKKILCLISSNNDVRELYQDGEYTSSSFTLLVEKFPLDAKRVKLFRDSGEFLGEYPIKGNPIPTTMNRVKIII